MNVSAAIALASVIIVALIGFISISQAVNRDKRDQERSRNEQRRQDIADATQPLRDEIQRLREVVATRDERINTLLDERRGR